VHRLQARALEATGEVRGAVEAWCRCQSLASRDRSATALRLEALKGIARLVAVHPDLAPNPENPGSACPLDTLLREERPSPPEGWGRAAYALGRGLAISLPVPPEVQAEQRREEWDELDVLELTRGAHAGIWLTPHVEDADPAEVSVAPGMRLLRGEEAAVLVRSSQDTPEAVVRQGLVVLPGIVATFTVSAGEATFVEDALAALSHVQRVPASEARR
jgi:hypothetical protein